MRLSVGRGEKEKRCEKKKSESSEGKGEGVRTETYMFRYVKQGGIKIGGEKGCEWT